MILNKLWGAFLYVLICFCLLSVSVYADIQYAILFDGSNDYINAGNIPLNNKSFTIECWAKRDTSGGWDLIFAQGQQETNRNLQVGFRDSNVFTLGFGDNDLNTTATYTDSNWHHWAVTFDINTKIQKIYRDGVEVANRTSGSNYIGTGDIIIGRYGPASQFYFDGQIDELRLWDTPRTQTQIQEYMYRTLSPEDETNLLAYYQFNQSSGYTLNDSSINRQHGSLINLDENTAWVVSGATVQDNPGVLGFENALLFDGGNDYVNAGSNINLANESFTIEFWSTRNSSGTFDLIFALGTFSTNNNLHIGYRDTNSFTIGFGGNDLNTSTTYGSESWHHWAVTFDANTKKRIIYRDGNLIASDTSSSNFVGSGDLSIGKYITNEHYHDGSVDELRVWNVARTQSEIREHMYQTLSQPESYNSLLAYYQFNQSSGTTLYDMSGNNNNGTLTNMDSNSDWIPSYAPVNKTLISAPKNAIELDGVNDYLNIGPINLANKSFTIEFWTAHLNHNAFEMVVFLGVGSTNNGLHIGFRDSNTFTFDFLGNAVETTTKYTDSGWHHWAVTFNATTKKRYIYRDGQIVASDTSSSNFTGSGDLLIGNYVISNPDIFYKGKIDEFRVWEVERTYAQIIEHMNQPLVGNETGLIAYYNFDQQFSSQANDQSSQNYHAPLTNMDFSDWVVSSAKIHDNNGPGGIGSTIGLSDLKVWLKADSITSLSNGDALSFWSDSSGWNNAASQTETSNQPLYQTNQINGYPAISFSGYPNSTGGADFDYLNLGILDLSPGNELSVYIVGKVNTSGEHYFWGRYNPTCRLSNKNFQSSIHSNTLYNNDGSAPGSFSIISMDATDSSASIKWNGAQQSNPSSITTSDFIESNAYWIGATESNGYSSLNGAIAEVIVYGYTLNAAQQTLLDNYLSSKYGISIPSDKYVGDESNYNKDVAGIGKESDGSHTMAQSAGLILKNNAFLTDNGDYVLMGHSDASSISFTNETNDLPLTIIKRLSRIWYIDRTDGAGSANGNILIGFDFSEAGLSEMPLEPENYSLLYRSGSSGTFSTAQTVAVHIIDDQIYFEISEDHLNDGYYTLGWKSISGSGNALIFDGTSEYVEIPYNKALNGNVFTISVWAKVTGGQGTYRSVVTSRTGTIGYIIYVRDNNIWSFWTGNGGWWAVDGDAVVLNKWTHLAMTYDGSKSTGYINGIYKGQQSAYAINTTYPLRIGAGDSATPNYFFPGEIDEFRYYNYVLSQDEIRQEMCQKVSENKPGLVAYYRFDHSSGTTLLDLSGNKLNGTLYNMDYSNWVASGAHIGDVSVYDYNGSNPDDFSVSLSCSDADSFTAVGYSGTFQGIHLYRIDDSPNVTTPPASFESMLTSHYWGVFTVGSSPTYSITYDYGPNEFTDENSVQLAYRENNADTDWSSLWTIQNKESNLLSFYGMSTTNGYLGSEFIFGIEPVNYTSGDLIAYYPFNGNANDESGNGNDGTIYGAKLTTDRNGYKKSAFSFNGTDEWIELTDFGVPETFSVALWLNIGSATNQAYLGKDSSANSNFFILGGYNGNKIEVNIRDNVSNGGSQTTGYHFLTAVIEKISSSSSKVTMYLDETICWQNTYNTVVGSFSPGKAWTVGQEWNGSNVNSLFTGTIDEISFFNRALNPAEVRYLYQRPISISTIESPAIVSDTISFTVTTEESSQITISVHSSNQSALSDSNINLASSGSNQLTLNTSASTPVNLTLTLTPESSIYTRVTITCFISKAGRLTESVSFPVILSPPGSGNALDFDGSNDYIDLPDNVWFHNDFTVETWIYYRSYVMWDRLIDVGNGPASNNILISPSAGDQYITFQIYNGTTATEVKSSEKIPLNQWVHVAATATGTVGKLYINGRLVGTNSSFNQASNVIRNNAYIGKSNWSENPYANMILDEFRIWNVGRTESEIRQSMCQKLSGNETGLVLYFNFDNTSGTTAYDLSGNDRHGTLKYMAESDWISSTVPLGNTSVYSYNDDYPYSLPGAGKALQFDGSNDYIELGSRSGLILGNAFTIEAWIYPTLTDSEYHAYIGNQTDPGNTNTRSPSFYVKEYNKIHYSIFNTSNNDCSGTTSSIITHNQWNHVAVIFDGTTLNFYVNGISSYTETACSGFDLKDIPINLIGKIDNYFKGYIDEVRLWNIARTESQIQNNIYSKLEGNETGLVGYYRFDSLSGSTAYDSSGNDYHGTLKNMGDGSWNESSIEFYDAQTNLTIDNWAAITSKGNSGSVDGIHIYTVKESPNNTTKPDGWHTMDTTNYFGVFIAGENSTYSISCNYSNHQNVNQADSFVLAYRSNADDSTWEDLNANVDSTAHRINQTNMSPDTILEFALGFNYIPTIASIIDQSINEDATIQSLTFTAADAETADCSMTLTTASSNTSLISINNISYTCSLGTYYMSLTPTANQSGTANITITFTDSGSLTSTTSFTLTVNEINDPPVIGSIDDQIIVINTSTESLLLTATDIETATCSLGITFNSSNASVVSIENISYTCASNGFYLMITPLADQTGTSTITTIVTDAGGLTASTSFVVMISTPPTISEISAQSTATGTVSFTIADGETDSLLIRALSSDQSILADSGIKLSGSENNIHSYTVTANIQQSLTLTMSPIADQHGRITVTVVVSDSANLTSSTSFSVIVSPPGAGRAIDFDGTNEYIDLGTINGDDPLALAGTNFTFSLWIKPALTGDVDQKIINKNDGLYGSNGYCLQIEPTGIVKLQIDGTIVTQHRVKTDSDAILADIWQHVAITGDGSEYKCYINGISVSIDTNAYISPPASNTGMSIGKYTGLNRAYKGLLDEVQIWNRALSQEEIRQNMCQRQTGNETGLILYYRFDHVSGTIIKDLSGNGYNGTLTNMADSDWITSGASLGDVSSFDYTGSTASDFSVNLSSTSDSDSFTAVGDGGTYNGIHLYYIDESPNITLSSNNHIYDNKYWGVFPIGTSPTYEIEYVYNGNSNIVSDAGLDLLNRSDNSDNTWTGGQSTQNAGTQTITQSNISGASIKEFYAQINHIPQLATISDQTTNMNTAILSLPLTATDIETTEGCSLSMSLTSSNTALISTENLSYTCSAGIFYISMTPTHNQTGSATITATVTDAGNLTSSCSFNTTVSEIERPQLSDISPKNSTAGTISFTISHAETGQISVTVISSDSSVISYTGLNLSGTGSYSQLVNVTANEIQNLTLSITPLAGQHDRITLTVIASDANGITSSSDFSVIVSPPGSGNALEFDDDSDYISLGSIDGSHPLALVGTNFSLCFWIKPTLTGDDWQRIIDKSTSSADHYVVYVHTDNKLRIMAGSNVVFISEAVLEADKWQHIAITMDGASYLVYHNGRLLANKATDPFTTPTNATGTILMGKSTNTADRIYDGILDEFSIWSRALTVSEIRQNMCQKLIGNENGLLAYYRFDSSQGSTLLDLSGNDYDATLVGKEENDWVTSGAPLGYSSVYDYVGTNPNDFSMSMSFSNGDALTVIGDGGSYSGIHMYLVNESPNTSDSLSTFQSMDTSHYYGVFTVGSSTTYSLTYYYGQQSYSDDDDVLLAFRENNADTGWSSLLTVLHPTTKELSCQSLSNDEGYPASEFMFGTQTNTLNTKDLIAHYPLNGNVIDATCSSHDGYIYSGADPRCITDRHGISDSAYLLDGYDDFLYIDNYTIPDNFTVSTWLYFEDNGNNQAFIGKYQESSPYINLFLFGYYYNQVNVEIKNTYYRYGTLSTGYHLLTAVVEKIDSSNSLVTVYVDQQILWQHIIGQFYGTDSSSYRWTAGMEWDRIDSLHTRTDYMKGKFDEISLFNRALNANEIRYLYNLTPVFSPIEHPTSVSDVVTLTLTTAEATQLTVTARSSDQSIISDSEINLNSSGTNQMVINTSAQTPMNLTVTVTPESRMYGRVLITCSVIGSTGITETTNYPVIVSPPGAGMALDFDGSNDYIDLGEYTGSDPIGLTTSIFTMSFWIKPAISGDSYQRIIDKSVDGLDHYTLYLHSNALFTFKANGTNVATVNDALEAGVWQHVAFISDGISYTCYINGFSANMSNSAVSPPTNAPGTISIGRSLNTSDRLLNAQLDEFQIWNRVLTQSEVRQNMCQKNKSL
jgi:hypothetical protein